MKTIEEKAKAYDEALKVLHKYDGANIMFSQSLKEEMFPELKESEDEKWIPKEIAKYLKEKGDFRSCWIAWLEKQGEQNPTCLLDNLESNVKFPFKARVKSNGKIVTIQGGQLNMDCKKYGKYQSDVEDGYIVYKPEDLESVCDIEQEFDDKAEPKFHEGDWIVYEENIYQIHNISLKNYYECISTDGTIHTFDFEYIDSKSHLWTIQDTKDGDVLNSVRVKATIIFKNFNFDGKHINAYCALQQGILIKQELPWDRDFKPATKEWRELLFQKMKEAGYEWDAEKKELRKIENKNPLLSDFFKAEYERGKADAQKSSWSEEDEDYFDAIITKLEVTQEDAALTDNQMKFLKSLKSKIHLKQEWSEEDDVMIRDILRWLPAKSRPEYNQRRVDWLKSLKNRINNF